MFDSVEVNNAAATARGKGAVGKTSAVVKYLEWFSDKKYTILDYGAGYGQHSLYLKERGFNVVAYDFFPRRSIDTLTYFGTYDDVYNHALEIGKFDIVFANNVINVQSSVDMLSRTLYEIASLVKHNGMFVCNYPKSPRKIGGKQGMSNSDMMATLDRHFESVVAKPYSNGMMFLCF